MGAALLLQLALKFKRFLRGSILMPCIAPIGLAILGWWLILDPPCRPINWMLANVWPLPFRFRGIEAFGVAVFVTYLVL